MAPDSSAATRPCGHADHAHRADGLYGRKDFDGPWSKCEPDTAASVDYTTCLDCGASVRRSTVNEARFCPMCGSPLPPPAEDCPHLSWSGDEGPIEALGRFPKRWRCDGCGTVRTDG